jgi:hypothetical protein
VGDPPSKADRRLLHHVLQTEFVAALVIVSQVDWAAKDAQWLATTLQFVGAMITFGGLLWAYIRARSGLGLWELLDRAYARVEKWVRRFLRKGRDVVIRPGPATLTLATSPRKRLPGLWP